MTSPKLFGLDPGSSHAAAAGLDASTPRPHLIAARTWAVGHDEPLDPPRPLMQKQIDGSWAPLLDATGQPRMRTHRHVTTLAEAQAKAREIVAWLVELGATHLLIERVDYVAPGETIGATVAMATGIAHSAELGAAVSVLASDRGIQVATTTRQHAYAVAVGGAIKGRGKRAEEVLRAEVDGWTERPREGSGEERRADHDRDACVCALAAVKILRGEEPTKAPRVRASRRRGPPTPEELKARHEREARKAAKLAAKATPKKRGRKSHADERESAILGALCASAEPLTTSELSRRTGVGDDRVSDALRVLGESGKARRVGRAWQVG